MFNLILLLAWVFSGAVASAALYQVGPSRAHTTLQSVAGLLNPGDVVEVDGDVVYPGNVTFSRSGTPASAITVSGLRANGRRPVLSGTNLIAGTRAVLSLLGSNYIVQGFEIHGALNTNISKAGVYHNADQCVVRDTLVRDCHNNGIQGADASGSLTLDKVEIFNCGNGTQYHQIYVGSDNLNHPAAVFRMQFCFIHNGRGGNNVKSRVGRSEIYYNWIERSAYSELDLIGADPAAQVTNTANLVREDADVVGNVFYKNADSLNVARLGSDGTGSSNGRYRFVNNTIFLESGWSTAVLRVVGPRQSVELHNNVIYHGGSAVKLVESTTPALGASDGFYGFNNWLPTGSTYIPSGLSGTVFGALPYFADAAGGDYSPTNGSPLLDAGRLPTQSPSAYPFPSPLAAPLFLPTPRESPIPLVEITRNDDLPIDIGAYEALPAPPRILQQPVNLVRMEGQAAAFNVLAGGSHIAVSPLQYQWYINSVPLPSATNTSFSISSADTNAAGGYQVIVTNILGAATSSVATLTISLDTSNPVVVISYPAERATVSSNQLVLSGTVKDNVAATQVRVGQNGAGFVPATLGSAVNGLANWSLPVMLPPGTNVFQVYAADAAGNRSLTNARTFFFATPVPLVVEKIGGGKATPDYNTSNLFIGRSYFMTAAPLNTNWIFTNWLAVVDGTTNLASIQPKLSFTMQSNLTLLAQFVSNRFNSAAGKYNGLFLADPVRKQNSGFITVKVTGRQTFSATLTVDGDKCSASGVLDISGAVTPPKQILRKSKSPLSLKLQLNFDDTLSGTVSNAVDGWTATIDADKAVFSLAAPAASYLGKYTVLIPGTEGDPAKPAGDGYAIATIVTNGTVSASGGLGDGQPLKLSATTVSAEGRWPLYSLAYISSPVGTNTAKTYNGMLIGWVQITNNLRDSQLSGNLYWVKTGWTNGCYDNGFTNSPIPLLGSVYLPPAAGQRSVFITNGIALFADGNLSATITNALYVTNVNVFKVVTTNTATKFFIASASGLVSGSFKNPDNAGMLTPLKGVYLQSSNLNVIGGRFLGTNQSGSVTVTPAN